MNKGHTVWRMYWLHTADGRSSMNISFEPENGAMNIYMMNEEQIGGCIGCFWLLYAVYVLYLVF
jgi:hypothetical protein